MLYQQLLVRIARWLGVRTKKEPYLDIVFADHPSGLPLVQYVKPKDPLIPVGGAL